MNLSYCVPRQRNLLKILLTKNEWITGVQLSCMLHVTDRTVRSDVSVLNYILEQYNSSILSARGKGYYLQSKNKEALHFILSKNSEFKNISKETCIRKILLLLLITNTEIDLYDLEEKLFISRTSLESYIKNIEKILELRTLNPDVTMVQFSVILKENNIKPKEKNSADWAQSSISSFFKQHKDPVGKWGVRNHFKSHIREDD